MRIVRDRPPMFDEIDAKFKVRGKPVLFAWADTIFIPTGSLEVPPHLMEHESLHGQRQRLLGVEVWWRRYIDDIDFRREEELLAHRAEYQTLIRGGGGRNMRRHYLSITAARLASPLYGPIFKLREAKAELVK